MSPRRSLSSYLPPAFPAASEHSFDPGASPRCLSRTTAWAALLATALAMLAPLLSPPVLAAEHPDARNTSVDANPYHLDPTGLGILSTGSGETLGTMVPAALITLGQIYRPIVLESDDGELLRTLVGNRQALDISGAIGLHGRFEVGFLLPIVLHQAASYPGLLLGDVSSAGVGDLYLLPRTPLLRESRHLLSLSFNAPLSLPTGNSNAYMGVGGVTFEPGFTGSRHLGPLQLAMSLGFRMQPKTTIYNVTDANKFTMSLAAAFQPASARWRAEAEITSAIPAATPFQNPDDHYAEAVLGGRYRLLNRLSLLAGCGTGLFTGVPSPVYRAFLGVSYDYPRTVDQGDDRDGDGIADADDGCISRPEDLDGFQDTDGCPDTDNDEDGIDDADDACPDLAEDFNDQEDEDGCPDADTDGDGIEDLDDPCPDEPEDLDGFQDEDGCPDADNDDDQIPDTDDACPDQREDLDGFQDEDGCPDTDNDQDGVPDIDDACPDEPEDMDQYEDEDGCPEDQAVAVITSEEIVIKDQIHFETAKATLRHESLATLDEVLGILERNPQVRVSIEGHTDDVGSERFNQELSEARARSVLRYLVEHAQDSSFMEDRLSIEGYGESRPIADNSTPEGKARNRRVEFKILKD